MAQTAGSSDVVATVRREFRRVYPGFLGGEGPFLGENRGRSVLLHCRTGDKLVDALVVQTAGWIPLEMLLPPP